MANEKAKRVYINLYKKGKDNFTWEKDGKYFYVFPASQDHQVINDIVYWVLVFRDKVQFDKKCWGERVNADMIASIKDKSNDKGHWLWGMLFDNEEKKAYYLNMWDNSFKAPGKDNDKYLSLTETEYRERATSSNDEEKESLPF